MSISSLADRPSRISTGFKELDKNLGGGLSSGLIILGAGPSSGKSTFAIQMAQNIALHHIPVLYFSLEMKNDRIAAKLISRQLFMNDAGHSQYKTESSAVAKHITADTLFRPDAQDAVLQSGREEYENTVEYLRRLKYLFVQEGHFSAKDIYDRAWEFVRSDIPRKLAGESGTPYAGKPLVIVDYLQILSASKNGIQNDKQAVDYDLRIFKKLADGIDSDGNEEDGFPVMLISSLNRSNYGSGFVPPIQMDAFKETGGIEYSADVLLGLQFTDCHTLRTADGKKRECCNAELEKKKFPRRMEIKCLKQRYGMSGWDVQFKYYAPFDCFIELDEAEEETSSAGSQYLVSRMINCKVLLEMRKGIRKDRILSSGRGQKQTHVSFEVTSNLTWPTLRNFLCELIPEKDEIIRNWGTDDQHRALSRSVSALLRQQLRNTDLSNTPLKESYLHIDIDVLQSVCGLVHDKILPDWTPGERLTCCAEFLSSVQCSEDTAKKIVSSVIPSLRLYPSVSESRKSEFCEILPVLAEQYRPGWIAGKICSNLDYRPADHPDDPQGNLTEETWPVLNQIAQDRRRLLQPLISDLQYQLTCSDFDVLDAVYSVSRWNERDRSISLKQINQALTGDRIHSMTPKQKEAIRCSLERLSFTDLYLDASEEIREKATMDDNLAWDKHGPLLAYTAKVTSHSRKSSTGESTGFVRTSIQLARRRTLPLFSYVIWNKQIVCFPENMLIIRVPDPKDPKGKILSNTADIVRLKRYLIHRLEILRDMQARKGSYVMNTIHLFSRPNSNDPGLLNSIGIPDKPDTHTAEWNNKVNAIRSYIRDILQFYRKKGYLQNFEEQLDAAGRVTGYTIQGDLKDPGTLEWEENGAPGDEIRMNKNNE